MNILPAAQDLRLLAFFLPQFHPIPENDQWWGPGFSDWRNVVRARPVFRGHYQPHLPADLGFYDLRSAETRQAQTDLARAHGVDGFIYYHYWFGGRRLLHRPVEDMLTSGRPDFPFALCWAYESWTRTWDGRGKEILVEQSTSATDLRNHAEYLVASLRDPRSIRVEGRPIFLIYKASLMPDVVSTIDLWRSVWLRYQLDPYLIRVDSSELDRPSPRAQGFDASLQFSPDFAALPPRIRRSRVLRLAERLLTPGRGYRMHNVYDYESVAAVALARQANASPGDVEYPCVSPAWDNTPRRRQWALILRGSTPSLYEKWLRGAAERHPRPTPEENFLFINAWNEWAEGAHLEPDLKWGKAYLQATSRVSRGD